MRDRPEPPPCLFGALSLDGTPLPAEGAGETLFRVPGLRIARAGAPQELRIVRRGDEVLLLRGRLFDGDAGDLARAQGCFVLVLAGPGPWISLATDKLGTRRMFYRERDGILEFATHLAGFATLPSAADERALLHLYNFGVTPNDHALVEGVRKLQPASILDARPGSVSVRRYFSARAWYRPEEFRGRGELEICREIDVRLERAVRRRLPEGEPVGVALSGGVDSGYLAQKLVAAGARVVGYNLAYGDWYHERDRIDRLARALGIEVRRIRVGPEQVLENYARSSADASEPLSCNNATMRIVGEAARRDGIGTLFDGDGVDRLFLGSNRHLVYRRVLQAWRVLRRTGLQHALVPALGLFSGRLGKLRIFLENCRRGLGPYPERNLGGLRGYDEAYERRVFDIAVARHRERFEEEMPGGDDELFASYLAIQMCPEMFFVDPAEIHARAGVFPIPAFWDDEIVSLALSIPTRWKIRNGATKYVLRRAAGLNLDPEYWMLPKIGMWGSLSFALRSAEGARWRIRLLDRALASSEHELLRVRIPGRTVQTDRLLKLALWKSCRGL